MASGSGEQFTIDLLLQVPDQIRHLARIAKPTSRLREYLDILRGAFTRLEEDPLAWGDPEYHGKHKGSTVCHGIAGPVHIKYVVFEPERLVLILQVKAMPNSWLD